MTNLSALGEGLQPTAPTYWKDSYQTTNTSNIVRAVPDEKRFWYIVLDETIFHPKGGGQPSDRGTIQGPGFKLEIRKAMFTGSVIVHWGRLVEGTIGQGPAVSEIDWDWRYLLMRRHSAGHLLDHTLAQVLSQKVETLDSWLGDPCYVAYKGDPPNRVQLDKAEQVENQTIQNGGDIKARQVTPDEFRESFSDTPNLSRLPSNKQLRLVTIEGCRPIACGGTHLHNIQEAKAITIKNTEPTSGGYRIHYDVL